MTATTDTPAFVMAPKDIQRVIIGLMVMMALIVETAIPEALIFSFSCPVYGEGGAALAP